MSIIKTLATVAVLAAATACGPADATRGATRGATGGATDGEATSEPTPAHRPTRAATPGPTDDPADDAPAFPDGTADQSAENTGEWDLVLTDVRVGEHDGFDRVVLEFTGTGVPGWSAGYVDEAVMDGSGEVVQLEGDTFLDVYVSGTTWPADGHYDGPARLRPGTDPVAAVHVAGAFEGYTQVLVGLDGRPAPFRTFALRDPARLVVDVLDDSDD